MPHYADTWPARSRGALRIMSSLLFIQHGTQKLFQFPPGGHGNGPVELLSLMGIGGLIELVGSLMLLFGLFTRPVAFVLAGQMAIAYFMFHLALNIGKDGGFFPIVNGGDLAILFCFVFLDFFVGGPGAWSIDGRRRGAAVPGPYVP